MAFDLCLLVLLVAHASASITCLKVGTTATAQWIDERGLNCSYTSTVGINFGIDQVNNGKYVDHHYCCASRFADAGVSFHSYSCNGRYAVPPM